QGWRCECLLDPCERRKSRHRPLAGLRQRRHQSVVSQRDASCLPTEPYGRLSRIRLGSADLTALCTPREHDQTGEHDQFPGIALKDSSQPSLIGGWSFMAAGGRSTSGDSPCACYTLSSPPPPWSPPSRPVTPSPPTITPGARSTPTRTRAAPRVATIEPTRSACRRSAASADIASTARTTAMGPTSGRGGRIVRIEANVSRIERHAFARCATFLFISTDRDPSFAAAIAEKRSRTRVVKRHPEKEW